MPDQVISSNDAWVTYPKPNPQAHLRLFCFPYAGGSSANFRTWPAGLPADVEVCAVTLPGRGMRVNEAPYSELEPLIEAMAEALLPHLERSFAFFGHSLGALLAFELTRYWRQQHIPHLPLHLFVSGRWAPTQSKSVLPRHDLPDVAFLAGMRRLNGIPTEMLKERELLELLLPALRADLAVHESYVYQPDVPLACPITVFGGLQDSMVARADLTGWGEQTTASFLVRMVPGDHFFLHTAQPILLGLLTQELGLLMKSVAYEKFRRCSHG